jgi:dolichol-phosphate mannosyltransferase
MVLPTYNERDNIGPLIRELYDVVTLELEVLVVDDASPDGTAQVVQHLGRELPGVRLIRRARRGLTKAIQEGIDAARGEVVVWMDCDFSMPPAKVPQLVAEVLEHGADAAIGSRWADGGAAVTGGRDGAVVRIQKVLTRRLNALTALLTGADLRDWTSGFIAVRASTIRRVRLRGDHGEYFITLMAELLHRGARCVEVPYRCAPRLHGESKTASSLLGFTRLGLRYLRALLAARRAIREGGPA